MDNSQTPAWARFYDELKAKIEADAGKEWGAADVHTLPGGGVMAILFTGVPEPDALVWRLIATSDGPIGTDLLGRHVITAEPVGGPNCVMAIVEFEEKEVA